MMRINDSGVKDQMKEGLAEEVSSLEWVSSG